MKMNFKMLLACLCAAGSTNSFSQQYLRGTLNGGVSTIKYSSDDIAPASDILPKIGGGLTAEYVMFLNPLIGVSGGVGFSMSQSKYELNGVLNESMPYYLPDDEAEKTFVYNAKFENWEERQMIHTIDIPVGAVVKLPTFGSFTAMAGAGVKVHVPIIASYKVSDGGSRTSTGYYSDANLTVSPDIPHHGFYTLTAEDGKWKTVGKGTTSDTDNEAKGDLNTKAISLSAYLDLGVMHDLKGQKLYYGVYGQYGFTPLNGESDHPFLTQYGAYDSPLNTTTIDKSRLFSFGIKIGYMLPIYSLDE